uniref:Zinc finger protein 205 n=1 Tax=Loxodonta africana TaxID=9785 RepID=G3U688_LOXAF
MSTDGGGSWATQDQEGAREVPGHRHPYQEILSESDETRPLGATQESPHIKTEPEEPLAEGVSPEEGALSTQRWAPLSRGSKEKTLLLPGVANKPHRSPQAPALSQEERTRDQQMAAALLTAWSQFSALFNHLLLILFCSQSPWHPLFSWHRPFWASHVQGKGSLTKASLTVHPLSLKALAPDALGDVKPFRTMAGRGPGGSLQCGQQASSSQGSEQTKEDTLPGSLKQGQPKTIPPATSFLETQEEDIPEKPSEEEKPAAEAAKRSKEALAAEGDTGEKPYTCPSCWKSFSHHSTLIQHQRIHTGEKPYMCDRCAKRFTRRSDLVTHQGTHTGAKPHKCPVCSKCFTQSSALVTHQRTHRGVRPYSCPLCGKSFSRRRSDLVTHQGTHTGAKPHKCPVCSKCFTQSSALVTHQGTHTGAKPHKCPVCSKCFTQSRSYGHSSNLVAHKRTHTSEKPYHCLECDKSLTHSMCLTAHQRTHRGIRPYSCLLCGKSFSRCTNLHQHEKIHTTGPRTLAMLMQGAAVGALAAPSPPT